MLRIGNMRGVDLSLFEFDGDLPWYAFFFAHDGRILGRFGGRDADTPAKYLTLSGLKHAMAEALQRHKAVGQTVKNAPSGKPKFAESFPAASNRTENACIHCHHVHEFQRDSLQREKLWSLENVWIYPPPENIGLTLDADKGKYVKRVSEKSPAAKVGMEEGAILVRIGQTSIASVADVQFALHKAPKSGPLQVEWSAGGQMKKGSLDLTDGWRKSDVSWRWSLKSMSPNPSIIGDDLDSEARTKLGLEPRQLAYRHMNFLTPTARHAGLMANDIIVGVDDQPLNMSARQFETHLRLHYRVGQEVTLNVLRGKDKIKLRLKLPE